MMQFSPLELLLGATAPAVVTGMLRFTVPALSRLEVFLFRAFLMADSERPIHNV